MQNANGARLAQRSRLTGAYSHGSVVPLEVARRDIIHSIESFGDEYSFWVESASGQRTTVKEFRSHDGTIDMSRLAHAIRTEVEADGWVLLDYLAVFLQYRIIWVGGDGILTEEVFALLNEINGYLKNDLTAFLMYQKLFPLTTAEHFATIAVGLGMRKADRLTNNLFYALENALGFPNGSLCDMSRK